MAEKLLVRRNSCRLCGGDNLPMILKMAPCPPVDAFVLPSQKPATEELLPMDLYLCTACGHAQLLDVVSPSILFGNYIYTTTSSPGLVEYFRKYADEVSLYLNLSAGDKAIDIGSNDGTLLKFFKSRGLNVLGVDPAEDIAALATSCGIPTLPSFFTKATALEIVKEHGKANIITANNVFAHSDDLADMLEGVRELLDFQGTFVFEVSYLLDLIQGKVFDFIYHEHLSHHSVLPLTSFMARHGMKLVHVERNQSKGGSIRCFARLAESSVPVSESVESLIQLEKSSKIYDLGTYEALSGEISRIGSELHSRLETLRRGGAKIVGYGASATGTVLLHHFDIGKFLSYIVDDNVDRQGRLSPGHALPVMSSNMLITDKPDYVVILAWRFARQIMSSRADYLEQGGHFIVPLPNLTEH